MGRLALILTASTALVSTPVLAAEFDTEISAKFGVDYTSDGDPSHSFMHEVSIDFLVSGTTDGGLSFGAKAGFDNGAEDLNEGKVHVSGAFGTLTIGNNDSADLVAGGIADVGLFGIGVDNIVEGNRGGTENQFRYDNSFGQVAIAISAGTTTGTDEVKAKDGVYAYMLKGTNRQIGGSFFASSADGGPGITLASDVTDYTTWFTALFAGAETAYTAPADGIRLNDDNVPATSVTDDDATGSPLTDDDAILNFERYVEYWSLGEDGLTGTDDMPAAGVREIVPAVEYEPPVASDTEYAFGMSFNASGVTVGVGYDSDKTVSAGLGFATGDIGMNALYVRTDSDTTGIGGDVSYTIDASKLTLAYARSTMDGEASEDAMGIHVSHDLGGGASVEAGFGQVKDVNKASAGLSFSF